MLVRLLAACAALLLIGSAALAAEEPPHRVEIADGAFQVRVYAPMIIAETTAPGPRERAAGRGFDRLAGYIFGANQERAKIAMTAPVVQAETNDAWRIQFVMPKDWSMATLPAPNDAAVRLQPTAEQRLAVVRFSGSTPPAVLERETIRLRAWIAERGLTEAGPPRFAFYDPPWIIPAFKRNEVMIPVT
jgi:hypothetical protein